MQRPLNHSPMSVTEDSNAVAQLITPIGATIGVTDSLRSAAERMTADDDVLLVLKLSGEPAGVLSADDVQAAAEDHPETWRRKRCASLVYISEYRVRPDHSVEAVLQCYKEEGVRPLPVFNGGMVTGVIRPEAVRRWCKDQHDRPLEEFLSRSR